MEDAQAWEGASELQVNWSFLIQNLQNLLTVRVSPRGVRPPHAGRHSENRPIRSRAKFENGDNVIIWQT
eukprot:COSAG02_NODE_38397_length_429_cov_1.090909_1_plen_68_part_10